MFQNYIASSYKFITYFLALFVNHIFLISRPSFLTIFFYFLLNRKIFFEEKVYLESIGKYKMTTISAIITVDSETSINEINKDEFETLNLEIFNCTYGSFGLLRRNNYTTE
jgi:hypothetical protein